MGNFFLNDALYTTELYENCLVKYFHVFFLGLHLQHTEVPGLIESEMQLTAYAIVTATLEL